MNDIYPIDTLNKPFDFIIKENLKEDIVGVEIGVYEGNHAKGLLNLLPNLKKLYLIDPYIAYSEGKYFRNGKVSDEAFEKFKSNVLNTGLKNRIVFIRDISQLAYKEIKDNIDFVYIDGNHSRKATERDLELYYPLIKKGGILGGDDYLSGRHPFVTSAVDDFIKKYNLKINYGSYNYATTKSINGYLSTYEWWVFK